MENQTQKSKLRMPEASKSAKLEDVMQENQRSSFLNNHYTIDRFFFDNETLNVATYLTGKHFFLKAGTEDIDHMQLRLDITVSIYKNTNYYCEITVNRFVIRYKNKIIYYDKFENDSEIDKQYRRSYNFAASNFVNLMWNLNNYFTNIFYNTIGVPNPEEYPILIMDGVGEEITKAHYELDDNDSDEIQKNKMAIEKMLRDTYEQRFKGWAETEPTVVRKEVTNK